MLVIVEAVARLLPGVINGNSESLVEESLEDGLLEYPVYTKPATWRGLDVPPVLTSGNHGLVHRWRREERLLRTARRRPDLLAALDPEALDPATDRAVLDALRVGRGPRGVAPSTRPSAVSTAVSTAGVALGRGRRSISGTAPPYGKLGPCVTAPRPLPRGRRQTAAGDPQPAHSRG